MNALATLILSLFTTQILPTTYLAEHTLPCGASRLAIVPEGASSAVRPLLVVPVGPNQPAERLRYDVLLDARLRVFGVLTGRVREDAECGAMPELLVLGFAPAGDVRRVFCAGCLEGMLHVYNADRPRDRFVPEDFEGGPEPRLLDADRCRPASRPGAATGACPAGQVAQSDGDGTPLCCPFLP